MKLEPISAANAMTFRDIRLRALLDTPSAFGSKYVKEILLTNDEWIARAAAWNGTHSSAFLAFDDGLSCGIAGTFLDSQLRDQCHLVSMWVAPSYRQRGVGRLLVTTLQKWAYENGARAMNLMVTSNNDSAMRFYESLGFSRTGHTIPYPNDPSLVEFEMSQNLG